MNTRTSTNYIPLYGRSALLLLSLLIGCFAFSLTMSAVSPAPDGGYPAGNTAEGDDALFNLSKNGYYNTAIGFHALFSTPGAIITPQPALPHSVGTRPELVTRPTVLVPCFRTPPVAAIPRLVLERCSPTQPASRTRPLVGKHFSQTRPDSTTRPMVFPRSPETRRET